jgi:phosphate transport system substrate-binding protein
MRLLGVSALLAGTVAAVPSVASAKPVITLSGSTSVAPLASLLARGYLQKYPGRAKFRLAQGGSDVGVADVGAGRVSIGMSSRDLKPSDPGGLVWHKIARDAICVVTNNANPVSNFSQSQIQAIFGGSVRNWSGIQGSPLATPISVVVRTPASGTQDAFQKIFMGTVGVTGTAAAKASNGLVQQAVKSDRNGVGYVSLDFVAGVHPVAYQGVACNLRNAKSGAYGGVRNFWMVTRGAAKGAVRQFISWVQNSKAAQQLAGKHWVPLR